MTELTIEELKIELNKAKAILNRFIDELDADHTNMVRCTVGDLGVELEYEMRAIVGRNK